MIQQLFASASVFGDVGSFEQTGDNCHTARAGSDDFVEIVDLDSADAEDGQRYIGMDLFDVVQTDRLVIRFRGAIDEIGKFRTGARTRSPIARVM